MEIQPVKIKIQLVSVLSVLLFGSSLVFAWPGTKKTSDDGLSCETVHPLMAGFLTQHLNQKKLTPELEDRSINQFIKTLDPSKLYLKEADVKQIKDSFKGAFEKFRAKDCSAIEGAQKIYSTRVKEALDFAKKILGADFKFKEDTTLVIDPQKRAWAKDDTELHDLQSRYIQFQISNYLAGDMKLPEAKKQLVHRYEVLEKNVREYKKTDTLANYLDAFATSLDPHSDFMSKDLLEEFEIQMRLSLEGIGATLSSQDGYTVIENLVPGGAAAKSELLVPKDKIIAVGQGEKGNLEQVIDMPLRDVVKQIRGKKGTKVRLSILRQGKTTERLMVTLIRDKIDLKDEAAKISYVDKKVGEKNLKIGIINLPSFYADPENGSRSCSADVKKLVEEAKVNKVDGLVLDLSKNGGGVLGEAVRIAGLFIRKGNIVETEDAAQKVEPLADLDSTINYSGPLVVLTSRLSASASEIVAGALKDYKRAVIIGSDRTFGKGTVQAVMKLREDLGAIKVTTGMFFTPSGESTQEKGVASDIKIPSPFMGKEFSEEALDYALHKRAITNFISPEANDLKSEAHFSVISDDLIAKLRKTSEARVKDDKEFAKIVTELKEAEAKAGVMKLSDAMKKTIANNAKDKDKTKPTRRSNDLLDPEYLNQPAVKESVAVAADLVSLLNGTELPLTANSSKK
jgi:carboxyl-terminal processing protease